MCHYLDPASFLATVFASLPDKSSFDVRHLRKVRDHVVETLAGQNMNLAIEWTRDAVLSVMENYPDYFEYSGGKILCYNNDNREELELTLNDGLPSDLITALSAAIQDSEVQYKNI